MCTVTLTPINGSQNEFILTSNRDEASGRETLLPEVYSEDGVKMLFPKDVLGGGTWMGVSERKRAISLLNGEFDKHFRNPPYRLSRGVVVKDLLRSTQFEQLLGDYDLENVEPFTLIGVDWETKLKFTEFVWDGKKRHIKDLPIIPHIWSSSPLYTSEMKELREKWFRDFLQNNSLTPENLLKFHSSAGIGDKDVDVIMDRGFVKTQSITQITLMNEELRFYYKDLKTEEVTEKAFSEGL